MQVYKRSAWELIKGLVMAPFGAVLVFVIGGFLTENMALLGAIAALVFMLLVYLSVFSENIRFEIEDGELRYYKRGRLKEQYNLRDCQAGYRRRSDRSFPPSHDIKLNLLHVPTGKEYSIDCSPIGVNQFDRMFEEIQKLTGEEPEILQAAPAGF